jgi:hypothetical protein
MVQGKNNFLVLLLLGANHPPDLGIFPRLLYDCLPPGICHLLPDYLRQEP